MTLIFELIFFCKNRIFRIFPDCFSGKDCANRQLLLLLAFCELAPAFFRQRSRYSSVEFLSLSLKNEGKKKKKFVAENEVI
jgi:hypothetical protein